MNQPEDKWDNASVGANSIVEPNVQIGLRYHDGCGSASIGANSILRTGTIIYGDVRLGRYFQSGHYTVIRAKVTAGDYCTVSNHSTIEGLVEMGEGVRIMSHVYVPTRTRIGDHVFIGPGTTLLNDKYPGRVDPMPTPRGPIIDADVVIGGNCTILPGVHIGERSFIAAGANVISDVPAGSLVIGNPGRIQPLPADLDRPNNRALTLQRIDIWHPNTPDLGAVTWGEY